MTEPAAVPQLSLSVGDRVVYPNQGLCTVTDIKTEEIAGQKLVFVSLQVVETGARVKAPQEKLARIGIRRLSGTDDVKRVFDFLKGDSEKASLDWKKRARDNTLRLSEGGLRGLAEVVKGLQVLSELRPLPPKEREQYNDARHLFVTELAAAMAGTEADAEDALDIILFPVGKERPKRSVEEFKELAGDDELGLGDDLLGLGDEPADEPEEAEAEAEAGDGEGEGDEDAPKKAKGKEKAPPKKKAAKAEPEPDDEGDAPADEDGGDDGAEEPKAEPKKRGRPAKAKAEAPAAPVAKPAAAAAPEAAPAEAKKRGRPAKPKPAAAEPAAPKKRGRPPKAK